jgi:ketosteroid isomerase-like protein
MGTVENKKLIQDAFTAWARGDGMAFFNLLAEDVHWTVIGSTPVSRTYAGREAFVEGAVKPLTGKARRADRADRSRHHRGGRQGGAAVGRAVVGEERYYLSSGVLLGDAADGRQGGRGHCVSGYGADFADLEVVSRHRLTIAPANERGREHLQHPRPFLSYDCE